MEFKPKPPRFRRTGGLLGLALASLLIIGGIGLAQTSTLKKVDRPVFVSAQTLAVSCQAVKDAVGEDYLVDPSKTYKLTAGDVAAVGRCTGYIEGVARTNSESLWVCIINQSQRGRGELLYTHRLVSEARGRAS